LNNDGIFSVLDIITLQKWLFHGEHIPNSAFADINKDNKVNVIDLALIKQALLKQ